MSILAKWGLGATLTFGADAAIASMTRAQRAAAALKTGISKIGEAGGRMAGGMMQVGMVLAPLVAGFGFAAHHASGLASDLEGQMLTMRVMLGDATKAQTLVSKLIDEANRTPFESSDLIEGSKRLLKLSDGNVDRNLELLRVMETMAALNPGKSVVDAVEALKDAASGGGFERMKEFQMTMRAEDFEKAGKPGGKAWADAVFESIKAEMTRLTHGEDIVKALSETFAGRMSTFGDVFNNMFTKIGEKINASIGPEIGGIGDWITAQLPDILGAVDVVIGGIKTGFAMARPYLEHLRAWWEGMGGEGRQKVIAFGLGFLSLATVVLPLAGVLGTVATVVGGLVTTLGALGGLATPEVLIAIAAAAELGGLALAGLGAAAVAIFGAFRKEGEGPLDFLRRLGGEYLERASAQFQMLQANARAFLGGLWSVMGPALVDAWSKLEPALRGIGDRLVRLFGFMQDGTAADTLTFFGMLGQILGYVWSAGLSLVVDGVELLAGGLGFLIDLFQPLMVWMDKLVEYLLAIFTGSLSAKQAFTGLIQLFATGLVAVTSVLLTAIMGAVEFVLRAIAMLILAVPGAKTLFGEDFAMGADGLAGFREKVSAGLTDTIAKVDFAASDRAEAKATASSPTVVAQAGETKTEVTVVAPVKLDGQEIARATGGAAVRSGERGKGPSMPATQRGRVLRSGLQVTPLSPVEVL